MGRQPIEIYSGCTYLSRQHTQLAGKPKKLPRSWQYGNLFAGIKKSRRLANNTGGDNSSPVTQEDSQRFFQEKNMSANVSLSCHRQTAAAAAEWHPPLESVRRQNLPFKMFPWRSSDVGDILFGLDSSSDKLCRRCRSPNDKERSLNVSERHTPSHL